MNNNSDKKLLQQVAKGSEQAFRKLVFLYSGVLGEYIFRLTKSKEITEEIVQDVFLKIWMSREVLDEIENFRGYIFIISRNYTLNALRKILKEQKEESQYQNYEISRNSGEELRGLSGLIDQAIEKAYRCFAKEF